MRNTAKITSNAAGPLLALLTALLIGSAAAQPTSGVQAYDVELVIFRTLSDTGTPEQWHTELDEADTRLAIPDEESADAAGTLAPSADVSAFPALAPGKFKLTAIEESLKRSRNYQPLAHFGWTQPGFPRDAAQFFPVGALVPAAAGISGQIALSRGRYLHLTLDLAYDAPATATEPAQRYLLRQTRRMRSNERHYIDHPKFGVIAIVTPSEG